MTRPRVFVTRHLPGEALDLLARQTEPHVWQEDLPPPKEVLLLEAARSHGLLTLLTDRIDAEVLGAGPRLVAVSNMATGFDNVDVAAASRHTVLVTRTPSVLTESTADFAFALLLAAARRVVEAHAYVRGGQWQTWGPNILLGEDVYGTTLGIVGLGRVGMAVARRARGFGMHILYYSRTPKLGAQQRLGLIFTPLEELLRQADFVSLHVPLTADTYHLIGERQLPLMKPTAVLVWM
jgi:glyoxylate reductase